jgi:NADH-dependent peroxiredoxin subunit F
MYDVIIIGAGPAGLSAAVYATRQQLNVLILTKNIGGQILWSYDVENYLGFKKISGAELVEKFFEHLKEYKAEIKEDESVESIDKRDKHFSVKTDKEIYEGKTIIVTSGKEPRKLNVTGEEKLSGKGVSYCATCDGLFFKDQVVAVVGGGNAGIDSVIQLDKIAKKIYVIEVLDELKADKMSIEQAKKSEKVKIMINTKVKEIKGDKEVSSIIVENKEGEKELKVDGVFVEIGSLPSVDFVKDLKKNKFNEIIINNKNETNIPGIFAAGDVTDVPEKQAIIAAGEGAKAALSAFRFLSKE